MGLSEDPWKSPWIFSDLKKNGHSPRIVVSIIRTLSINSIKIYGAGTRLKHPIFWYDNHFTFARSWEEELRAKWILFQINTGCPWRPRFIAQTLERFWKTTNDANNPNELFCVSVHVTLYRRDGFLFDDNLGLIYEGWFSAKTLKLW